MVSCLPLYQTHPNAGENIKMETEKIYSWMWKQDKHFEEQKHMPWRGPKPQLFGALGLYVSAARIRLFLWEKKEKVASSLFRTPGWSHSWGWDEAVSKMKEDWIWTMYWSPCEMELSVSCRFRKTQAHPWNQEMNQAVCWLPDFLKITTETHFVWNDYYYEFWWRL